MLDYLIKGGTVVDGTGAAGFVADVGIRDGRIAAIGKVDEEARETVDGTGLVVCPGFVDPHTHYDAQLFWDPSASPSNLHGVTSVIGGNCGFTLAPLAPQNADYLLNMMCKVEGMPKAALENGVPWDWDTFGSFLGRLDGNLGVNAASWSDTAPCAGRSWARTPLARKPPSSNSKRCANCSASHSIRAAWACRRRAPSPTPTVPATRCRPAGPPRTRCCSSATW